MQEAVDRHQMQHLFAARLNGSTIQKIVSKRNAEPTDRDFFNNALLWSIHRLGHGRAHV
jgi:hypothetical protein